MLFGNTQTNLPSRFVEEIDPKYLEIENNRKSVFKKVNNFVKEEMFTKEDTEYQTGDLISHTEYGQGVIISVDKSIITVAFPHPYGVKKLMKNHKSISKVSVS